MNPDNTIHDFNLSHLLKQGDLNLRNAAASRKKLTTGEYFKMLSAFLSLAPDVSVTLEKYAENGSGIKNWKSIKDMIVLFEKMGCLKFNHSLNTITSAHGKGDNKQAALHAQEIKKGFDDLHSQVMSAIIKEKPEDYPDEDSNLLAYIEELEKQTAGRKRLVLAVDDSPAILEAVSSVLGGEYEVFKLPKPAMLKDVLKQVNPDLFLLDYLMPDLNGFELIPIIRSFTGHIKTPIIFLTSEGTLDNITAAIGLGACDFIVKPFNPDQLREKVAKHIT